MCLTTIVGTILSIATNILVGVWGLVMLVVGILVLTDPTSISSRLNDLKVLQEMPINALIDPKQAFASQASMLITLGLIIMVVCVFGLCCGQCGNLCRLVYVIGLGGLVGIITILLICLTTPIGKDLMKNDLEKSLHATYKSYLENPETVDNADNIILPSSSKSSLNSTAVWFNYQSMSQCCGVNGDFAEFKGTTKLPASCCQLVLQGQIPTKTGDFSNYATCLNDKPKYANKLGCIDPIFATMLKAPQFVSISLIIALILLIASLTCAVFLLGD